jgi:hypothetical protein
MQRNNKGQFSTKNKKTEMIRVTKEEKKMVQELREKSVFAKCECGHDREFHRIWTDGKCNLFGCNCQEWK